LRRLDRNRDSAVLTRRFDHYVGVAHRADTEGIDRAECVQSVIVNFDLVRSWPRREGIGVSDRLAVLVHGQPIISLELAQDLFDSALAEVRFGRDLHPSRRPSEPGEQCDRRAPNRILALRQARAPCLDRPGPAAITSKKGISRGGTGHDRPVRALDT
jgi:hypothetical protein